MTQQQIKQIEELTSFDFKSINEVEAKFIDPETQDKLVIMFGYFKLIWIKSNYIFVMPME
ncbi:hypothetical protein [Herbiconiux daphne]|uniref:Uncharacterized protein n=1 Tax=Herbiconiux daphne TaxID=2970914 RepID=A0ABT2H9I6_9MICO|nr:hypothetical protein [Herbiconiux daphne]MCS5736554.1 hypothetical protein [Herbiconiux daphne]